MRMSHEQPWTKLKSSIYSAIFRHPKSTKVTLRYVDLADSDRLLDIGCGPGAAIRHAAAQVSSATGVDASEPMVTIARKRSAGISNVEFAVGPAEHLPFEENSFSVVWTIQSWHHWNDPNSAFAEVRRVLAPGGRFFIVEKETTGEHGITQAKAAALTDQLTVLGYANVRAESVDKLMIISASKT